MKVLVIIGHQRPGSFCHAIAATVMEHLSAGGHEVIYHDLYEECFDPILPEAEIPKEATIDPVIQQHCDEVTGADAYVMIHPNWWGQPPAMLKGWIDRVLRQGVAYGFGEGGVILELLEGKKALVFTTSNTPRDVEVERFGDPLENLWKTCIFGMCGIQDVHRRNFEPIIVSTPEQRSAWLDEVRQIAATHLG